MDAPERGLKRERRRVGRHAEELVGSYLSHHAAMSIATSRGATELLPATEPGQNVPVGRIYDALGREVIVYTFGPMLFGASMSDFDRIWLSGALISLGDQLAEGDYFDHAPRLEMVRHLRNAVAHNNRFKFTPGGLRRLAESPAHTEGVSLDLDGHVFRVVPELEGDTLMFDFMHAHHIVSLIQSVAVYLMAEPTT